MPKSTPDLNDEERVTLDPAQVDGPTLEIGQETDLMALSHEEQVEIALADLDEDQIAFRTTAPAARPTLPPQPSPAAENFTLDPQFIVVQGNAGQEAPAAPAPKIAEESAVSDRPTIVPEIPITMEEIAVEEEVQDNSPTRPFPPEFKYIGEFMNSPFMEEYEKEQAERHREKERRLSGQSTETGGVEPAHFTVYYQRFLNYRKARETAHLQQDASSPVEAPGQGNSETGEKQD